MSDSVRPCRQQPTRLPGPWDSPGKNTGVGCHFLLQCTKVKSQSEVTQSCPTLLDPMDCSLPGSSVHGIFQGRVPEWVAIAFSDSEPSASYLLSKWIVNEWMQPLHRWPICSVVLSKFIVRLGAFVLFWCLHWPVTLAVKCWFYSRNTWAHILSRSEELPQTLFSSLFLSTFLQLKHWLRRQHEEIKFLSAQESHTSGPVTGRPPWSYLSFPASQSGKRREGWSSLRCFISMSYFLSRWFWQLPTNRKSLITSIQWCYSHITSLWLELGTAFLNLGIIDSWGWMSLCCGVCPVCYRTAAAPLTSTLWRPIAPTPS